MDWIGTSIYSSSLCNLGFGPVCDRQGRDSIPICQMRNLKFQEGK